MNFSPETNLGFDLVPDRDQIRSDELDNLILFAHLPAADLVPSTPNRDSVVNYTVFTLALLVRSLGLPVRHPLEPHFTRWSQRISFDEPLGIVRNLLSGVTQMLHVCLRWRGIRRPRSQRLFVTREFKADQVARGGRAQKLSMA